MAQESKSLPSPDVKQRMEEGQEVSRLFIAETLSHTLSKCNDYSRCLLLLHQGQTCATLVLVLSFGDQNLGWSEEMREHWCGSSTIWSHQSACLIAAISTQACETLSHMLVYLYRL